MTSPPYWGLRDYGTAAWAGGDPACPHEPTREWIDKNFNANSTLGGVNGTQSAAAKRRWFRPDGSCRCGATREDLQVGLEATFEEHVDALVRVFREVHRVLRPDGTLWLNYGDSYTAAQGINKDGSPRLPKVPTTIQNVPTDRKPGQQDLPAGWSTRKVSRTSRVTRDNNFGLKPKDLMMMPARVALALQADGWWLRSEIVWHKPNPMPESVRDRPTSAHEKLFLLTKAARYFYDAVAVRVACSPNTHARRKDRERVPRKGSDTYDRRAGTWKEKRTVAEQAEIGANLRNVRTIPTHAYPDAHFATFPPKLVEPCIKAGCPVGGVVLDPFGGSGTVGLVASRLGRDAILIELNLEYAEMAERRIHGDAPLLADVGVSA